MSVLEFSRLTSRERCGLKGPRAAEWLAARGIEPPPEPNTWARLPAAADLGAGALVARLGASEFFLEGAAGAGVLRAVAGALRAAQPAPGVYPVLREDAGFLLSGDGLHDVLAQVCNLNFAALSLAANPVIMTLMIGVAVLVIPGRSYRIWCDPTFAGYLEHEVGAIVIECGGNARGIAA
jgi:sarcosine oxidase subunit gamma